MRRFLLSVLLLGAILGGGTWISRVAAGSSTGNGRDAVTDTVASVESHMSLTDTVVNSVDSVGLEDINIQ